MCNTGGSDTPAGWDHLLQFGASASSPYTADSSNARDVTGGRGTSYPCALYDSVQPRAAWTETGAVASLLVATGRTASCSLLVAALPLSRVCRSALQYGRVARHNAEKAARLAAVHVFRITFAAPQRWLPVQHDDMTASACMRCS